jgi:hypothetical protein
MKIWFLIIPIQFETMKAVRGGSCIFNKTQVNKIVIKKKEHLN